MSLEQLKAFLEKVKCDTSLLRSEPVLVSCFVRMSVDHGIHNQFEPAERSIFLVHQ